MPGRGRLSNASMVRRPATGSMPRMGDEPSKPSGSGALRLAVWASRESEDLLGEIATHGGIEVVRVGAAEPVVARDLATRSGGRPADDPREALASAEVDALLLLAPDALDTPTLRATLDLDKPVLAERPVPVRVEEWTDFEAAPRRPVPVPRISASRHWLACGDWIEAIGPIAAMHVSLRCHPSEGSLAGRLADGLDLVLAQLGMPARIAAFGTALGTAPESHRGEDRAPTTMTAGFADGRWATVQVAIGPHPWHRGVELLGENGMVRWTDREIEWIGPAGIERGVGNALPGEPVEDAPPPRPGAVIGEFLHRWWLRQAGPSDPPLPHRELLSCLEATRLSARTGCHEDPGGLMSLL